LKFTPFDKTFQPTISVNYLYIAIFPLRPFSAQIPIEEQRRAENAFDRVKRKE
jgi:hypothetical protein